MLLKQSSHMQPRMLPFSFVVRDPKPPRTTASTDAYLAFSPTLQAVNLESIFTARVGLAPNRQLVLLPPTALEYLTVTAD